MINVLIKINQHLKTRGSLSNNLRESLIKGSLNNKYICEILNQGMQSLVKISIKHDVDW